MVLNYRMFLFILLLPDSAVIFAQNKKDAPPAVDASALGDDSVAAREFGQFFEEHTEKLNAINTELLKAETAKAAAIGVVRFTYVMSDMARRGEVLDRRYPMAKGDMPPKLKEKSDAFTEAAQRLGAQGIRQAVTKFGETAEMKFAMEKLRNFGKTVK